ncbi:MAG TPA: arsenate reductase ArsC [Caulobacteraceae bacterium]|nr:arsenate reductase ArsC [Caulobacteraceae bacterium]
MPGGRQPLSILFLCTGNSARSILAEAIVNRDGAGAVRAHSAGSMPKGAVHPRALELLTRLGYPTDGLRSKPWEEFAGPGAPILDFVVTVCDNAAGEVCPIWPGRPITAHWGVPDPAAVTGGDAAETQAFAEAYRQLKSRIDRFLALPVTSVDRVSLQRKMQNIGDSETAT